MINPTEDDIGRAVLVRSTVGEFLPGTLSGIEPHAVLVKMDHGHGHAIAQPLDRVSWLDDTARGERAADADDDDLSPIGSVIGAVVDTIAEAMDSGSSSSESFDGAGGDFGGGGSSGDW